MEACESILHVNMLVYADRKGHKQAIGVAIPRTRARPGTHANKPTDQKTSTVPIRPKAEKPAPEKKTRATKKSKESKPKQCRRRGLGGDKASAKGGAAVFSHRGDQSDSRSKHLESSHERYVSRKLDDVLTAIDDGSFSGYEKDLRDEVAGLESCHDLPQVQAESASPRPRQPRAAARPSNIFIKATLYANSQIPADLPTAKLYLPAYALICLAAQYSERAYTKPHSREREINMLQADWRARTKTSVLESVVLDHVKVIVLAIQGTSTFMDWTVNLKAAPTSPAGFLDDPGNLCHAGFLSVARKMAKPLAERLRQLLGENPSRKACSLVLTGHSAGGAVCSLLFAHMMAFLSMSGLVQSELGLLAGQFKRVHCITFGAPPVSMLPLVKSQCARDRRSMFLSFVNEGDPVVRAEPAYVRSLLDLYLAPAPVPIPAGGLDGQASGALGVNSKFARLGKYFKPSGKAPLHGPAVPEDRPIWPLQPNIFSNAGKIIVLTDSSGEISAVEAMGGDLRGLVFGDPLMHMMKTYRERVDLLAAKAVTGGAWSS